MSTMVAPMSYADVIRRYSDMVAKGTADTDLTVRQRRIVSIMLNLSSNVVTHIAYNGLTDADRDIATRKLGDVMWDAIWLMEAVAPRSADDISVARERAVVILRGC
jgi:hypothetical protein